MEFEYASLRDRLDGFPGREGSLGGHWSHFG